VTATAGTRPPTDVERAAARVLGRALDTAGVRDRVATRTRSALPPGRLAMRGALAADAQRAASSLATAEPFTRTSRRPVPAPPLRLGIACDVSGSMDAFAGPVASTAWILAHAAAHTRVPATTAAVIFGRYVRAIHAPGECPAEVTEFLATDNYEHADKAIDALDGALDLARPGAARLLVIVSDGQYRPDPRREAQLRVNRLTAARCGVLWLAPAHAPTDPLRGVTVAALSDPAATARAIGRAATTALRAAH
jgi:VWA domain-containing protein